MKKKALSDRQITNLARNMLDHPTLEQLEHTKQLIKIENEREMTRYLKNDRITSKDDYKLFLEADKLALTHWGNRKVPYKIWDFQRTLRKVEYYQNCKKNRLLLLKAKYDLRKISLQLGFTIPPNVFGAGLSIPHYGTVVVNEAARVGVNCRIHQNVTIGDLRGGVPIIGNNVWIGPNVVIAGGIRIADGVAIGANSYVDKDVLESNVTVAGHPAKKISDNGSLGLWIRTVQYNNEGARNSE